MFVCKLNWHHRITITTSSTLLFHPCMGRPVPQTQSLRKTDPYALPSAQRTNHSWDCSLLSMFNVEFMQTMINNLLYMITRVATAAFWNSNIKRLSTMQRQHPMTLFQKNSFLYQLQDFVIHTSFQLSPNIRIQEQQVIQIVNSEMLRMPSMSDAPTPEIWYRRTEIVASYFTATTSRGLLARDRNPPHCSRTTRSKLISESTLTVIAD